MFETLMNFRGPNMSSRCLQEFISFECEVPLYLPALETTVFELTLQRHRLTITVKSVGKYTQLGYTFIHITLLCVRLQYS